jgi:alpha-N-arabinofuranosidase
MFEGIKGGLHAELIRNRSFEDAPSVIGLPRHWERYPDDRNDDYGLAFRHDREVFYPAAKDAEREAGGDGAHGSNAGGGGHALLVEAGQGVIERHGIYQSRIPVRGGTEYRGYLWLKTEDYEGRVTVSLEADISGGEVYAENDIRQIQKGDWKKYQFALRPAKTDPLARLAILTRGRGRLWVDQVSLMPGDAVGGVVRADVFEKVKALRPAFVRWPGGDVAQVYHWLPGVGARDRRPTWTNLTWKNETEANDFGTDEYIEFCRLLSAEPTITVNVEGTGATPEEAAAWVEYCNGPATSRYGAMRAANGHPEPYNVRYWEVGNEIWRKDLIGHTDAETYARNFNRYQKAMRAADPRIKLIGVGDNDMDWNRTVLRLAGDGMDYLAIHHYYHLSEMRGDPLNLMARPLHYERFYGQVAELIREVAPQREIKLSINEWGLNIPVERQYSMESALYGARLMNVFERSGVVWMSAVSDLINGWPGGIIQASRHGLFVTPLYLANRLYSEHYGAMRLAAEVESPTFASSVEGRDVSSLDVSASRTEDGKKIYIKAVNTDPSRAVRVSVSVKGKEVSARGLRRTLTAETLRSANDFSTPEAVSVRRAPFRAGRNFSVKLPKHSVSVLVLDVLN